MTSMSAVDFYAPKKNKYLRSKEKINWFGSMLLPQHRLRRRKRRKVSIFWLPTWFHLIVEGNGAVENTGDLSYTRSSHEKGYLRLGDYYKLTLEYQRVPLHTLPPSSTTARS